MDMGVILYVAFRVYVEVRAGVALRKWVLVLGGVAFRYIKRLRTVYPQLAPYP